MWSTEPQIGAGRTARGMQHLEVMKGTAPSGTGGSSLVIPLIDIDDLDPTGAESRSSVVSQWRDALDSLGFVTVRGHGVPERLMADLQRQADACFEQPLEHKLQHVVADPKHRGAMGYTPPLGESVGTTTDRLGVPDLVESLSFSDIVNDAGGRETTTATWSDLPTELRASVEAYAGAVYVLGLRLMRLSAQALGLASDHFDSFYSPMQHKLRLAYYPELLIDPVPGQLRNAAHTDFAGFTILLQDNAPGGLQVLMPDGGWTDIPSVPGALVINSGDLLQRWTNDRWMSNVHRVVNPPIERRGSSRRLSVVFFTGPRDDAEIACLPGCSSLTRPARYAPITAGEHVRARIRQTYGSG